MYVPQRLMESGATAGGTSRDAGKTDSHLFWWQLRRGTLKI
jgi:hypothetical protein